MDEWGDIVAFLAWGFVLLCVLGGVVLFFSARFFALGIGW